MNLKYALQSLFIQPNHLQFISSLAEYSHNRISSLDETVHCRCILSKCTQIKIQMQMPSDDTESTFVLRGCQL